MSAAEFSYKLRVYIEDTDAGGIVYYVNYLKFMERARTEFMRDLGYGKEAIFNHGLMFVVRDMAIRYLRPAQLDDLLEATVRLLEVGGASLTLQQEVRRGAEVLVAATVTVACVERNGVRPQRLPGDMTDSLRAARDRANGN